MKIVKGIIVLFLVLCLVGCGSNKQVNNSNDELIKELKQEISNNKDDINELKTKVTELEIETKTLKEQNTSLNKEIESLKSMDTGIKEDLNKKYSELKTNISKTTTTSSKYTTSKKNLIGTWKTKWMRENSLTFTNDNIEVFDNWLIYTEGENKWVFYYAYKGGTLYIASPGEYGYNSILTK